VSVAIEKEKPVVTLINPENKEVVGKVQLTVSDPKTLKATNFFVIPEYSKVIDQKNP
jgi:hypothetical protein